MKSSNLVLKLYFPTPGEREESLQEMRRRERPRHEVEKGAVFISLTVSLSSSSVS